MTELIAYGNTETSAEFDVVEGSPRSLFIKGDADDFAPTGVRFTLARQNADDDANFTSLAYLDANNVLKLGTVAAAGHYKVTRSIVEAGRSAGMDITDAPDEG